MTNVHPGDAEVAEAPLHPALAPGGAGRRGGPSGGRRPRPPGPIGRTRLFGREVVSEMRKVIYPSRRELVTYVVVVTVFLVVIISIVAGLDYAFTKAVLAIFG